MALKAEKSIKNKKKVMLFWESKIIKALKGKTNGAVGNIYYVGQEIDATGKIYNVLIMDLFGENLQQMLTKHSGKFDL